MIETNQAMRDLITRVELDFASCSSAPQLLEELTTPGWTIEEGGAHLLTASLSGYHGSRSSFNDTTGYEASVNGTGIPDWDIKETGTEFERELLIRAISYARSALRKLQEAEPESDMTAIISLSKTSPEVARTTAHVTFVLPRADESRYIDDVEKYTGEAILIFTGSDCHLG